MTLQTARDYTAIWIGRATTGPKCPGSPRVGICEYFFTEPGSAPRQAIARPCCL